MEHHEQGSTPTPTTPVRLILFVADASALAVRSTTGVRILSDLAAEGAIDLEVVDVLQQPEKAEAHRVLATPTVLRVAPPPERRAIGDLTDLSRLAEALAIDLPGAAQDGRRGTPGPRS